jgi:hypothetical protein
VVENLARRLRGRECRFITLTVRHDPAEDLGDVYRRLISGWQRLRRTREWKQYVAGGVAVTEIKHTETGGWHPHLHIVAEGRYWPHIQLRRCWEQCTRGSSGADIRNIADSARAAQYVAKYASKPWTSTLTNSPPLLAQAIVATSGTRLIATFGSWRGWRPTARPTPAQAAWLPVGPLAEVLALATAGDTWAIQLLAGLHPQRDEQKLRPQKRASTNQRDQEVSHEAGP